MRVCMRVGAWVRGCAPHLAEVSKIAQDAPRAGATTTEHGNTSDQSRSDWMPERPPEPEHKHQSDHHNRNTSDHHKSTRAGAMGRPQTKRKYTNAARSIHQQRKKVKKFWRLRKKQ